MAPSGSPPKLPASSQSALGTLSIKCSQSRRPMSEEPCSRAAEIQKRPASDNSQRSRPSPPSRASSHEARLPVVEHSDRASSTGPLRTARRALSNHAARRDRSGSRHQMDANVKEIVTGHTHRDIGTLTARHVFFCSGKDAFWSLIDDHERCSCCTKETFWMFVQAFLTMDRRDVSAVRRSDFMWALGAHGASASFQKVIRKAGLSMHFHSTAEDLGLEGFIRLSFPNASASDLEQMRRWAELRKALFILERDDFKGSELQMKRIFDLLAVEDDDGLALVELLRSQILTPEEVRECLPEGREFHPLTIAEFCQFLQATLCKKYSLWTERHESLKLTSKLRSRSRGLPPLASPTQPFDRHPCHDAWSVVRQKAMAVSALGQFSSCAAESNGTEGAAFLAPEMVC